MPLATTMRPDPPALAAKARRLLEQGRPGAAQPLVAALRPLGASPALAAELDARLLFAQGQAEAAITAIDACLDADGPSAGLYLTRSEMQLLAGNIGAAAVDAAEAVTLDPVCAPAKALLGRALLHLGRAADAVACLDEALAALPHAVSTRLDLATALDGIGAAELGDATIAAGVALDPGIATLRNAAVLRRIRAGDYPGAVAMAAAARHEAALDACGFGLMGHALASLGRLDEAADAYVEALKLAPDDPHVRHIVAASGRSDAGDRAPAEYVRTLFDDYASRFDDHLIHLGYRVPGMMRGLLASTGAAGPVLDLGCGTGFLALACSDVAPGAWIGVDLSPRMLDAARAKALYAELHEADLLAYLAAETRQFPLIVAADVLCYFGPLGPLLQAVRSRLAPGGRFLFTVEHLVPGPDSVRLGRMGRYAHSATHVTTAARDAGFEVVSLAEEVLRFDGGAPVHGLVAVLEHAG